MTKEKGRKKVYSPYCQEAILLLGKKIKLARIQKAWSEKELAERANVSRETIQRAEKGAPSCAIGTIFELSYLVGIKLFDSELPSIRMQSTILDHQIALLPSRVRSNTERMVPDDDF